MRLRSLSLRLAEQKAAENKTEKTSPVTANGSCEVKQKSSPTYYRADVADNQEEMKTSDSTNCYYGDHEQIQVQQSGSTTDNMHGNYLYHEEQVGPYYRQRQSATDGTQACVQTDSRAKRSTANNVSYSGLDQQFVGTTDTYAGKDSGYYAEDCRNVPYQDYVGMDSTEEDPNGSPTSTDHDQDDASHSAERDIPKPINKKNLKRHRLSHSETRFLLNQFGQNPHPDAAQRVLLSKQINGLSVRQIQVWFQNRRAKLKRMSASDADRMLSTRSYPDGYGPQGFENQIKRQESPRDTSPCVTKPEASYPGQDYPDTHSMQPKHDPATPSQYSSRNISSVYRRPHLRSPLMNQHSPSYPGQARQLGYIRDGTNSPYSEAAMSRDPGSPQGSPAQYDTTTYGLPSRVPAAQSSARFIYGRPYPSTQTLYAPRSMPINNGYITSPEDSPVVQTPYRPYSVADPRAYYASSLLATPTYENSSFRQAYTVADQVSDYHAPGQDGPYVLTNAQPRPVGYDQHGPIEMETVYSDVRDTRALQTSASSPGDSYHLAPPMQREMKGVYPGTEDTKVDQEEYVDAPQFYEREHHDSMDARQHEMTYATHMQQATFQQRQASQQEYGSDEYVPDSTIRERDQAPGIIDE